MWGKNLSVTVVTAIVSDVRATGAPGVCWECRRCRGNVGVAVVTAAVVD